MEKRMTVGYVGLDNRIMRAGTKYQSPYEKYVDQKIYEFDKNNLALQKLERCLALCSNTELGKDQEGVHVLKKEVNGDASEAALLRFVELIDENFMAHKAQTEKIFMIPYSEVTNFDASIHLMQNDPNRYDFFRIIMKGEPGRIMERCTTISHSDDASFGKYGSWSQLPLSEDWKETVNENYMHLKGLGDLVLGFCELDLDSRKIHPERYPEGYPKGYNFPGDELDKMNFPLEGHLLLGLVSMIEESNPIEDENDSTVSTEKKRTVTHVWFGSKVDEKQSESEFDKNNCGWKMLERCISLCSNAVFREEQREEQRETKYGTKYGVVLVQGGLTILEKDVSSWDYAEGNTWKLRYVKLTNGGFLMDYIRAKNKKVCEINKYEQKYEFDVSIHYTPDNRYLLIMMGDPEKILKHCSTIVIDGREVPLREELEDVFNQACMELKGQEGHIFGFCELMLDEKKYPQGYAFDPDKIDTYIDCEWGRTKFVGLVSIIEESNIDEEKETQDGANKMTEESEGERKEGGDYTRVNWGYYKMKTKMTDIDAMDVQDLMSKAKQSGAVAITHHPDNLYFKSVTLIEGTAAPASESWPLYVRSDLVSSNWLDLTQSSSFDQIQLLPENKSEKSESMVATVPFKFTTNQEATSVEVAGSYNDWAKAAMTKTSATSEWSISLKLSPGVHQYKYIVDGDWDIDSECVTVDNDMGGLNNLIMVAGDLSDEDLQFLVKTCNKTEEDVKNYYKLFKWRHPTGYIDMKEFKKMAKDFVLQIMSESDPTQMCNFAFSGYDTDQDGFISFREVAHALYITREDGPKEEQIKFAFRMYDLNKSGTIEKKELTEWMVGMIKLMGQKLDEDGFAKLEVEVKEMIGQLDTNTDGVISEEEFAKGCMEDEDLFSSLCNTSLRIMDMIIKSDLEKLEWKQEMEEMVEVLWKLRNIRW